jgi:hypothetical protein
MPIACSLERAEMEGRAKLMAALGQDLEAVEAEAHEANLHFSADRREELEEFVLAESRCCPFFTLAVIDEPDRVRLDVSAPATGAWAVRGLVAGFVAGWEGLV